MNKTLPKGHLSCLSGAFRYTAASTTDIAKTFARIRLEAPNRELQPRTRNVCVLPKRRQGDSQAN